MMAFHESWAGAGSAIASLMFSWAIARQFFPYQFDTYIVKYATKLLYIFYPYIEITFAEYSGERFKRSEVYTAIESYLSGSCTERARRLKAEMGEDSTNLVLSMDDHEEVTKEFQGVKLWWYSRKSTSSMQTFSLYPPREDRRYYRLVFHQSHRKLINESYLRHVMEQGKAIKLQRRQRKLYTNSSSRDEQYRELQWSHVPFEHPATFSTVAMDPDKKQAIVQDLLTFSKSKDYYEKVGKPWKRGYLLYGPPGTGKSTMIAAMANLMDYDVFDLELTAVKDNTGLRKLLIETTSRSIIVIEDIDCSLNLSGKRKNEPKGEETEEEKLKAMVNGPEKEESKVTLSGLLNFIDGLWSACGSERLIVFTTNFVEKLDPALIRRGRMDMHIELSYCTFEAFKVLAKNYLGIEDHELFEEIKELIERNDITPADVAENLMPKTLAGSSNSHIEVCLNNLIQAFKECKARDEKKEDEETANGEIECKQTLKEKDSTEAANGDIERVQNLKGRNSSEAANGDIECKQTLKEKNSTEAANGDIERVQNLKEKNSSEAANGEIKCKQTLNEEDSSAAEVKS